METLKRFDMMTEYKKISFHALALILFAIRDDEQFAFSPAPFDIALSFSMAVIGLMGEKYRIVFAPSCTNTSLFVNDDDVLEYGEKKIAEKIAGYLYGQDYPEDRPDEDEMLFVKTADWDSFLSSHPDVRLSSDDVRDVTDEELESY